MWCLFSEERVCSRPTATYIRISVFLITLRFACCVCLMQSIIHALFANPLRLLCRPFHHSGQAVTPVYSPYFFGLLICQRTNQVVPAIPSTDCTRYRDRTGYNYLVAISIALKSLISGIRT